jgi:hypothetical protein
MGVTLSVGVGDGGSGVAVAVEAAVGVSVGEGVGLAVAASPPSRRPGVGDSAARVAVAGIGCGVGVAVGVATRAVVCAGGVSFISAAGDDLTLQAAIPNSIARPTTRYISSILPTFRLPILLFPHPPQPITVSNRHSRVMRLPHSGHFIR